MTEASTEAGIPSFEVMDVDNSTELIISANAMELMADAKTEVEETLKTEDEEPPDHEEAENEVIQEVPEENVSVSSEP